MHLCILYTIKRDINISHLIINSKRCKVDKEDVKLKCPYGVLLLIRVINFNNEKYILTYIQNKFPMPRDYANSDIQAVLFDVNKFTPSTAEAWLKKHGLRNIKPVHMTEYHLRYRIMEPTYFRSFITQKYPEIGVEYIRGFYTVD